MPVLTSEVFRFLTPADPPDVWNELTRTGEPVASLYGPGMLPVYITWQIEPAPTGTVVRLCVDETGPSAAPGLELTWLPALEALRTRVASRRHES